MSEPVRSGDAVVGDGFRVVYLPDRTLVTYEEGEHRMRVAAERLVNADRVELDRGSIRAWDAPHGSDPVDVDRIAANLRRAFEADGLEVYEFG